LSQRHRKSAGRARAERKVFSLSSLVPILLPSLPLLLSLSLSLSLSLRPHLVLVLDLVAQRHVGHLRLEGRVDDLFCVFELKYRR